MNAMRFRAKYVSASENGDYNQVAFDNWDAASDVADVDGPDAPYLLIQRQFEDPDRGECYGVLTVKLFPSYCTAIPTLRRGAQ